jgi:hypothetical protein
VASKLAVETIVSTSARPRCSRPPGPAVDRDMRMDVNRLVTAVKVANLEIFEQAE